MSRFFIEFFCLAVPKNFVGEPFCAVFHKISGSEKSLRIRGGGGGGSRFSLPKISVGESFTIALLSGSEKVYGQEGEGSIKIFHRNFFVS